MSKRSALITALLLPIAGCTVAVVLQGEGDYLLGVLAAIWSLVSTWACLDDALDDQHAVLGGRRQLAPRSLALTSLACSLG